ncbi:MAG: flagellar biosynthetic protein FliR, partial [Candidatus Gastranaerophilaceae bacterium]
MLESFLALFKHFPEFNSVVCAGLLIFTRFVGFILFVPIFSRKEIPVPVKISLIFILTIVFVGILKPSPPPAGMSLVLSVLLNTILGTIIGF